MSKDRYDPPLGGRWDPIESNLSEEQLAVQNALETVDAARATVESVSAARASLKAELVKTIKSLPRDQIKASSGEEVFRAIIGLLT